MNRCFTLAPVPRRASVRVAVGLLLGLMLIAVSHAQIISRPFPPSAKRGMLEVTQPPNILINGVAERLSPGARIRSSANMMVMSGQLVGQAVLVNYTRNPQGMVHEVWILTDAEAQQERSGLETITNIIFGSDADKPKTDDGKTPFNQLPSYPGTKKP